MDFIKLMLDANEAELNSSNAELEMKVDDEEENGDVTSTTENDKSKVTSSRILKHMSLKVDLPDTYFQLKFGIRRCYLCFRSRSSLQTNHAWYLG